MISFSFLFCLRSVRPPWRCGCRRCRPWRMSSRPRCAGRRTAFRDGKSKEIIEIHRKSSRFHRDFIEFQRILKGFGRDFQRLSRLKGEKWLRTWWTPAPRSRNGASAPAGPSRRRCGTWRGSRRLRRVFHHFLMDFLKVFSFEVFFSSRFFAAFWNFFEERLEILASERVKERVRESGLKWPKCGCEHESEMGVALI